MAPPGFVDKDMYDLVLPLFTETMKTISLEINKIKFHLKRGKNKV